MLSPRTINSAVQKFQQLLLTADMFIMFSKWLCNPSFFHQSQLREEIMGPEFVNRGGDNKKKREVPPAYCPALSNRKDNQEANKEEKIQTQFPDPPITYNQAEIELKEVVFNSTKRRP